MGKGTKWVFFDKLSKLQSKIMSLEEAQFAILKMRAKDWERFYIWSTGWENWQILKIYLASDQKNFMTNFSPTEMDEVTLKTTVRDVLELKPASEKTKKEITKSFSSIQLDNETAAEFKPSKPEVNYTGDDITWPKIKKHEVDFKKMIAKDKYDERSPRHELKIEVLLINKKGKTFRSTSKNISLSGALLEKNIPLEFNHAEFDAVIVNKYAKEQRNSRVTVKATTFGDGGISSRIKFENLSETQKNSLRFLLTEYLKQQKNYSQQAG